MDLSHSTSNVRIILPIDQSFRGFIRLLLSISTSRSFGLRDERTTFCSSRSRSLCLPCCEFGSHLYSSNHRFGDSPSTIFYPEFSLHRYSIQGIHWTSRTHISTIHHVLPRSTKDSEDHHVLENLLIKSSEKGWQLSFLNRIDYFYYYNLNH